MAFNQNIRSVLFPGGRLPDWMTGPDSSSESSDDEDDRGAGVQNLTKDSNKNDSQEKEKNDLLPPVTSSPSADEEENFGDSEVEEEEEPEHADIGWVNLKDMFVMTDKEMFRGGEVTLIRDHTLNVKQGATVELLDVEKFFQLTDRSLLSPVLCGLLNTRLGGKIYIGVKRCGLIRGIVLERKKRDVVSCYQYIFMLNVSIYFMATQNKAQ